jgi:hypothetical protein
MQPLGQALCGEGLLSRLRPAACVVTQSFGMESTFIDWAQNDLARGEKRWPTAIFHMAILIHGRGVV